MGQVMTRDDWSAYRRRASTLPHGTALLSTVPCPRCSEYVLRAVGTTIYPCTGCGMGWYPFDLDFAKRSV